MSVQFSQKYFKMLQIGKQIGDNHKGLSDSIDHIYPSITFLNYLLGLIELKTDLQVPFLQFWNLCEFLRVFWAETL